MVGKTGVARLALTTGAPVIPVAHWGAQAILPYGTTKPHLVPRHLVRMLAGPPVDLSAYRGRPLGREVLRGATAAVMADITGLLAQLRGKEPPAVPFDPVAARRAKAARDGQTGPAGGPAEAPGAQAEPGARTEPGAQTSPARRQSPAPGGARRAAGPAGGRSRPATTRPGRRRRRERGGHGRRHVGDDLRAGALRRGDAGRALGPAGGAGRGDQPAP